MVAIACGNPTSWDDIHACPCPACRALAEVYERCMRLEEHLYVHDTRMFNRRFAVCDIRKLFIEPAAIATCPSLANAVNCVLWQHGQSHCDALVSSWPIRRPPSDYVWERREFTGREVR